MPTIRLFQSNHCLEAHTARIYTHTEIINSMHIMRLGLVAPNVHHVHSILHSHSQHDPKLSRTPFDMTPPAPLPHARHPRLTRADIC